MPFRHLFMLLSLLAVLTSCGQDSSKEQNKVEAAATDVLPPRTSFNKKPLAPAESGAFRFITMGHLYGQPGLNRPRPSPSFVSSIPGLNKLAPELCVLLGDCFYKWDEDEIKKTVALLGQLVCPVINAPGNHDLVIRKMYDKLFGATWYAFSYRGSRFLILDTELDIWHISDAQLDMLKEELAACHGENPPKNLFIFGHKIVWGGTRETASCAVGCNDPEGMRVFINRPPDRPRFNRDIRPLLRDASKKVPIYWFGGDVGAFKRAVWAYKQNDTREEGTQLTYLATGLGNLPRDPALVVDVAEDGSVTIRGYTLATGEFFSVENMGASYWDPKVYPNGKMPEVLIPFLEK